MTCIVGLVDGGEVWIGGDAATTWDESARLTISTNPKVFRVGDLSLGYCGSGRAGRLLQYGLTPPKRQKGVTVDKYVSHVLVEALRRLFLEGGVTLKQNNAEDVPSDILVGYRGHLFRVDGDMNVDESSHGFDCVGAGAHVALGALHATKGLPARKRVMAALRAAETFNWSVRGPWTILEPAPSRGKVTA